MKTMLRDAVFGIMVAWLFVVVLALASVKT